MDQFWAINHTPKNSAFFEVYSVCDSLILTGRLQDAHVTERQSGQTNLFWRGFAINPEEH